MTLQSTIKTRLVSYDLDKIVDYDSSEDSETYKEDDEKTENMIVIGPLTARVGYEQIYEIFSSIGEILDVTIVKKGDSGNNFAFVLFSDMEDAKQAVRTMDGGVIDYQEVIAGLVDYKESNNNWMMRNHGKD